jgi:hypothetical protein
MGVLGMIVGALQIIPLGPLPLVQTFWLIALAMLWTGRRRGGELPAWRTGREEPWPSQREVAEERAAARKGRAQPAEPEPVTAAGPSPATARRKRKRRR